MKKELSVSRKYVRQVICIACALFFAPRCSAQIELSSGIDMSYPLLLNGNNTIPNYGQISFGIKVGIAYKPEDVQFFPILMPSFGRTRLPLKQFGKDVAVLNFNYLNVMLNENYVAHFTTSDLFIYGGIGFSYLMNKGLTIAGPAAGTMKETVDSTKYISNVFPAMNIGFEYVYGESTGKDLYLGIGINFQYILLLAERNEYYISVNDPRTGISHYNAYMAGNVISPGFYIAAHYMLHPKKKSKLYL